MSKDLHSAGTPGADRCSDQATGEGLQRRPAIDARREARASMLAQRLATVDALLSCWRRGLPPPAEAGVPEMLAGDSASGRQVSMRAIGELLAEAEVTFADVDGPERPDLAVMFARGLAETIEAALWNTCSGDGPALSCRDLEAAAQQVQDYAGQALRWLGAGAPAQASAHAGQLAAEAV